MLDSSQEFPFELQEGLIRPSFLAYWTCSVMTLGKFVSFIFKVALPLREDNTSWSFLEFVLCQINNLLKYLLQ